MVALRRMDRRHEEVVRAKCIEFAERAKREPAISDLMRKIETLKITAKGQRDNQKVDQNLTRLGVNIKGTSNRARAWGQVPIEPLLPPRSIPPKYSHQNQVVVKINSREMASTLGTNSPEELTEMVNRKLLETQTSTREICIAKISKEGNVAIQPVDGSEARKLRENTSWIWAVFGEGAELVTKSYRVVAHGVSSHKISPENKEASIQYLVDKNRNAFPDLSIKWISWLRASQEGKSVASLIIESADPGVANRMIDEGIVTVAHMHLCMLYNPDCRMKQCFRCLQYGHKVVSCTKEITYIALSEWSFTHHTSNLCTLHLKVAELRKIHVHNVYNPCSSRGDDLFKGTIPNLMKAIQHFPDDKHLAIGDFNLHHSA